MKIKYKNILSVFYLQKVVLVFICILITSPSLTLCAQCPSNIDFEKGDFTGWLCYTGLIESDGTIQITQSPPTPNKHEIYDAEFNKEKDEWGGFPKVCPNGSRYSVRLGNELTGRGAEGMSYRFTIPADQNNFILIYNYAIVLEDFGHLGYQQPRLNIKVLNVTDNVVDPCSSFDFVVSGNLPGFKLSQRLNGDIPVRYKDWSSAFINLSGNAGKTFEISFTTTDCSVGGHFGYAYIDINTNCSGTVVGAVFCPDDKFINLTAPPGFRTYKWFNSANTTLGTGENLRLSPPPRNGDSVFVEFTPYSGYGCADTLTIKVADTFKITANAGTDREFCTDSIQLGANPRAGEVYKWSPAAGLSNDTISNPMALSAAASIQYTLTVTSPAQGCLSTDVVNLVKKCGIIEFYVPNAFAPNSIIGNNTLRPYLFGYAKVNYFRVYNRFGQLLYSANSNLPGWDGTIKGKPAPTQTVVWMIEAIDAYGRIEKRQGSALLIR